MMGSYRLEDDPHYQDVLFLESHWDELLERYPDRWIAIWNKKVVASAQNESGLTPQLRAIGLQNRGVLIQEMETAPKPWILSPP
jgi:hypothetical protein